jgi:hypothetical protein
MAQNGSTSRKRTNAAMEDRIPGPAGKRLEIEPKSPKTAIRDASEALIEAIKRAGEAVHQPPPGSLNGDNIKLKKNPRLESLQQADVYVVMMKQFLHGKPLESHSSDVLGIFVTLTDGWMLITSSATIVHPMLSEIT